MTTLYRPVLIESAEQAEALPVGTMAFWTFGMGADLRTRVSNGWMSRAGSLLPSTDVFGWTALLPIEAVTITRQTELCKPGRTIRYIADIEEDQ